MGGPARTFPFEQDTDKTKGESYLPDQVSILQDWGSDTPGLTLCLFALQNESVGTLTLTARWHISTYVNWGTSYPTGKICLQTND